MSVFFTCVMLMACNQKNAEQVNGISDANVLTVMNKNGANPETDAHYFWQSSFEEKPYRMVMKRIQPINKDSLTQENMVRYINDLYADIRISFIKTVHDTMFVRINNSELLANQMGSGGAESYMAEVTYNLTELPGINYVGIVFRKGNHADPGIYSRTDFVHPQP